MPYLSILSTHPWLAVPKPALEVNARNTGCSMEDAGYTVDYRPRGLTIGIFKVKVAPKKNVSDPWKLIPISSSLSNWQLALEWLKKRDSLYYDVSPFLDISLQAKTLPYGCLKIPPICLVLPCSLFVPISRWIMAKSCVVCNGNWWRDWHIFPDLLISR